MKDYKVNISEQALYDLYIIYDHIAYNLQASENAKNQYNRIADRILKLNKMPDRYKVFKSEPEKNKIIHRMNVDNYAVFFL